MTENGPVLNRGLSYKSPPQGTFLIGRMITNLTDLGLSSLCLLLLLLPSHSDSLQPHGLQPTRLLCPWHFPDKNSRMGCHFLLQRIFPTQGSNPRLLHWQADSLTLSHQGNPSAY